MVLLIAGSSSGNRRGRVSLPLDWKVKGVTWDG